MGGCEDGGGGNALGVVALGALPFVLAHTLQPSLDRRQLILSSDECNASHLCRSILNLRSLTASDGENTE